MLHRTAAAAASLALLGSAARAQQSDAMMVELGRLRGQLNALQLQLIQRDEVFEALARQVRNFGDDIGALRGRLDGLAPSVSGPFLSGPPLSSDLVGVAKVAVFAPRVEADAERRRDIVFLKLRRVEAGSVRLIGETELGSDQSGSELPLDQNGGLYIVEWSTSEGHSYNLVLRDGTSRQAAATVRVKPLETHGRFIFVGYRVE
jgi:hypothetical protein